MDLKQLLKLGDFISRAARQKEWEEALTPDLGVYFTKVTETVADLDKLVKEHQECKFESHTLGYIQRIWKRADVAIGINLIIEIEICDQENGIYDKLSFKNRGDLLKFIEEWNPEDRIIKGLINGKNNLRLYHC